MGFSNSLKTIQYSICLKTRKQNVDMFLGETYAYDHPLNPIVEKETK